MQEDIEAQLFCIAHAGPKRMPSRRKTSSFRSAEPIQRACHCDTNIVYDVHVRGTPVLIIECPLIFCSSHVRLPTLSLFKSKPPEDTIASVPEDQIGSGSSGPPEDDSKGAIAEDGTEPIKKSRTRRARESIMAMVRRRSTVDIKEEEAKDEGRYSHTKVLLPQV